MAKKPDRITSYRHPRPVKGYDAEGRIRLAHAGGDAARGYDQQLHDSSVVETMVKKR